jgi:hypothetical protein
MSKDKFGDQVSKFFSHRGLTMEDVTQMSVDTTLIRDDLQLKRETQVTWKVVGRKNRYHLTITRGGCMTMTHEGKRNEDENETFVNITEENAIVGAVIESLTVETIVVSTGYMSVQIGGKRFR